MQIGFTLNAMKENKLPKNCILCGSCVKICPQSIDIPGIMKKLDAAIAEREKQG
jgi:predicted aldo/keto reductase-like oxidoreductase